MAEPFSQIPQLPVQPRMVAPRVLQQYQQIRSAQVPGRVPLSGQPDSRFPTGPLLGAPPRNPAMADARTVLGDMQQIMGLLRQASKETSPEYSEVFDLVRELNDRMRQARSETPPASPAPTSSPAPPAAAVSPPNGPSLPPLKATLGLAGRPGVTYSGPEVKNLQVLLAHLGLVVSATGIFDARTAAAVQEFQQRNGLAVTGVVGAETRRILNGLLQPQ